MKRKKLLIGSIIIFSLSFIYNWFADRLFNSLFMISLIIPLIIFIGFIFCFIFSIKEIVDNKKFIDNISIFILVITVLVTFFFPFRMAKTKLELLLYKQDRNKIIEMVKNNEMKIDDNGNVELPNKYHKISSSGEITVYQNDNDGILICFWIFRGTMSSSTKLIYSNRGEELIKENAWIDEIKSITRLEEKWFYVETNY